LPSESLRIRGPKEVAETIVLTFGGAAPLPLMTNFFLIVCFFVDKAKKNGYNSFSHTCDLQ